MLYDVCASHHHYHHQDDDQVLLLLVSTKEIVPILGAIDLYIRAAVEARGNQFLAADHFLGPQHAEMTFVTSSK